jgi:hypothetical protein
MLKVAWVPFIAVCLSACTTETIAWEDPAGTPGGEDGGGGGGPSTGGGSGGGGGGGNDPVVEIPIDLLPPPGGCRIWFPLLPPNLQPAPGICDELLARLPLGAWLLHRPTEEPVVYRID